MEIIIKYDFLTYSYEQLSNDPDLDRIIQTKNNNKKRITESIGDILNEMSHKLNGDEGFLKIIGCDYYEADYIKDIASKYTNITVGIDSVDNKEVNNRYEKIDNYLINAFKSDNALIKEAIEIHQNKYRSLKDTEIKIPVFATMSSGKSTLLNALIGRDLLPALNQATTATIFEIKINNDLDYPKAIISQIVNNKRKRKVYEQIDKEFIKEWNEKSNDNRDIEVEIETPSASIMSNDEFAISFVDTPGPNNSESEFHKIKTYEYLKNTVDLPICIYVLDATSLTKIADNDNLVSRPKKPLQVLLDKNN